MKRLTVLAMLLASSYAFSGVKITSFYFVGQGSPLAEICGLVEASNSNPSYVTIKVDPRGRRPGTYNTVAGADGRFCTTVVTYSGFAEANLMGEQKLVRASIHSIVK